MSEYEYRVIAAPTKGKKAKGIKTAEDRFSHALEMKMNEMAAQGWEYQRAEALPSVERSGLTSTKTTWHNVLVFRRALETTADDIPVSLPPPEPAETGKDDVVATTEIVEEKPSDPGKSDERPEIPGYETNANLPEEEVEDLNDLSEEERENRIREKAKTSLYPNT